MAGLVNYAICEDSSDDHESSTNEVKTSDEKKKPSMEAEWEDFEKLISDENNSLNNPKPGYVAQSSAYNNMGGYSGDDRLKNIKFNVNNFVDHNQEEVYREGDRHKSEKGDDRKGKGGDRTNVNESYSGSDDGNGFKKKYSNSSRKEKEENRNGKEEKEVGKDTRNDRKDGASGSRNSYNITKDKLLSISEQNVGNSGKESDWRGREEGRAGIGGKQGGRSGTEGRHNPENDSHNMDDVKKQKDKHHPHDSERKRKRSRSKSRKYKRHSSSSSSSYSSSSSSREDKHRHHHRRRHHGSKRSSKKHRSHHKNSSKRSKRSRSSSSSSGRSYSRSYTGSYGRRRGGRVFTRAVMTPRQRKMIMMNQQVALKNQADMVTKRALDAMVGPSMKSGTKLPKVFGDMDIDTFKQQLQQAYDSTNPQVTLDDSKLLKANEKKSNLPLKDPSNASSTPQTVLSHTMAVMHAKVQELTGVAVPKYYNQSSVNPLKYAEQLKKRKLLWGKKKDVEEEAVTKIDPSTNLPNSKWVGTSFTADDSGKISAKFNKLMGIKGSLSTNTASDESSRLEQELKLRSEEQRRKQEELLEQLDRDYEAARHITHTNRGVGLGFASHHLP